MTAMVLTEGGYQTIDTVSVGDKVVAYDPLNGVRMLNTIEKVEWISKQDYQACNAPQGYNDGEEPPTLKPEHVPFLFYVVNGKYTLFQDQSIWYERDGEINVYHAKDIVLGDTLFSDYDQPIEVTTVRTADGDGWWRFAISGDHSYVVDGLTLHNASRFWVGGGSANTWAATANTNWASSSGGALNATVPGSSDTVTFDTPSGSSNSVVGANITIQNMDCASGTGNYAGTLTINSGVTITCNTAGTVRFSAGMTLSCAAATSGLIFTHTSGTMNLTSNSQRLGLLQINGAAGTTQTLDALFVNAVQNAILTVTSGIFDANGGAGGPFAVTATKILAAGATTRSLILGGLVKIGGNVSVNQTIWDVSGSNLTFTKNSANIEVLSPTTAVNGWTMTMNGLTYNGLTIDNASNQSTLSIQGANTFSSWSVGSGWTIQFNGNQVTTVSSAFSWVGTPLNPIIICPSTPAVAASISCPSGTCTLQWGVIVNTPATGGATFKATNSLNGGNNTGWTITQPGVGPTTEVVPQRAFKAGATSQSIDIFIQDSSSLAGTGLTGLVYNASGLTAYYRKGATGTATSITLATQTVGGGYSSGGLVEIDATHTPGMYRFDIPDTVLASAGGATVYLQGAANMVPCIASLEIVAYDPTNATTLGLTNLDATVSSRLASTSISLSGGAVTVGTNNDKTAYSLSQTFPTNFSALAITVGGAVTAGTVSDKTGYSLTQAFPTNFSSLSIDATGNAAITSNIKKNTAKTNFLFVMTDSTNHVPTAGLTVAALHSIDGAAYASTTNSPTAVANGTYKIDLSAADMNGDHIMLRFTATGADDLHIEIVTQP